MNALWQARAFLQALHPHASAQAIVRLVSLPKRGGPSVRWHYDSACTALEEIVDLNTRGHAAFVQINPCKTMRSDGGVYENVAYVHALVLDIDSRKTDISFRAMLPDITSWGLPPSAVVHSGHGGHLYFFLDRAYPVLDAEPVAERLCVGLLSDAVHNPNRIMRLPGTWNWKDEPVPCYLELLEQHRYSLAYVTTFLDALGAPPVDLLPESHYAADEEPITLPVDTGQILARLPTRFREAVQTGIAPPGLSDMSKLDWAIMRALVSAGASDKQVREIYASTAAASFKVARAGDAYFDRTLHGARRDVISDLADRGVDAALIETGLFLETPDGTITPDMEECRERVRRAWGLPVDKAGNKLAN